jgi:oxygen-independent coproporphyrinogen-3 oxidase
MTNYPDYVVPPPKAAYIHIPFCISKCGYCDFNSFPGMESLFDGYVDALVREIIRTGREHKQTNRLDSVYFGGGTPTVLPTDKLINILAAIGDTFDLAEDCEITLEANPGTVDQSKLAQLRSAGFNRLSLGVQSLDDEFLSAIGRIHTAREALDAYVWARSSGFTNIGIDLIFALPRQTLKNWESALNAVVGMDPEHISLYELSIEEGTEFAKLCAEGQLDLPDEELRLEMYEAAIATLTAAGYEHYEVSNFARTGFRSRHNQVYWYNESYFGFGAGATSYVNGVRSVRLSDPRRYVEAINREEDPVESSERLTGRHRLAETLIQGLRLLEGVDLRRFRDDTGLDAIDSFREEISSLVRNGLVEVSEGRLRVTHKGLLLMNDVAVELIPT